MSSAVMPIPADVARAIRLVMLDVDGVMTDGGVYLGATDAGERVEMKRFDIMDGLGIRLLKDAGIEVAIITGRESAAVKLRAEELGITECHQDRSAAKLPMAMQLIDRLGLTWQQCAFVGDDLPDIPILSKVGLPAAVANAAAEVHAVATWTAVRSGGRGALREFSEALLTARGEWGSRVEAYLEARGG